MAPGPALDVALVGGLLVMLMGVTESLAAMANDRRPAIGLLLILGGAGATGWAALTWPGGIAVADVAEAAVRLAARMLR
jgi:hypothetical protein